MFRKVLVVLGLVVVLSVGMLQFTLAKSGDDLTEQNKLIVQRVITDLWNGENLESVTELYTDRFYVHSPDRRVTTLWSPLDWKRLTFENLHSQYPDLQVTINAVVAEGDRVVVDFTARGTHTGDVTVDWTVPNQDGPHWYPDIRRIPATGTREVWDGVLMYRLEHGHIVEEWCYWNGDVVFR